MNTCKKLLALGLCLAVLPAMAEIYRYTDAQGNVHYTDDPSKAPDAEPVDLSPVQVIQSVPTPQPAATDSEQPTQPSAPQRNASVIRKIEMVSPTDEQTIRLGGNQLTVSVRVDPPISTNSGQGIVFYVDGQRVNEQPIQQTSTVLPNVYRGTRTVRAELVSRSGQRLAATPVVTVYMMPPTVN